MPEFWTWWIENGPTTLTSSSRASSLATTCFVSWSATTAATATAPRRDPVPRARGQRARGDGDRRQPVGARARPELLLPAGSVRSASLLLPLVLDAEGRPRQRLEPLGRRSACRSRVQVPNVPSSIRASAASISARTCVEFSSRVVAISRSNVAVAMSPRWLSWNVGSSVSSSSEPGFSAWMFSIASTTRWRSSSRRCRNCSVSTSCS